MTDNVLLQEVRRIKMYSSGVFAGGVGTCVMAFPVFIIEGMGFHRFPALAFLAFLTGMIMIIVGSRNRKHLKDYLGKNVAEDVLREYIDLISYDPNEYISMDIIKDMSILPSHNRRSGSDLIRGTYRGIPVSLCDLLLQQVTSTGKSTTVVTVFRGQFLSCRLKKNLGGYVEIQKRTMGKAGGFLKRLRNLGTSVSHGRHFESVETENEEFNRVFDIRAEDPMTAFLVLTPQFMEKLLFVNRQYSTNFCFAGDTLYMAVRSSEDRFEPKGSFRTMDDIDCYRSQIRNDLTATLSLLDVLLNNDHLF